MTAYLRGLHRGYDDNLRVDWDRKGKGGYSAITVLNRKKRAVAVFLGDYVPGELDKDMESAVRMFESAPAMYDLIRRMNAQGGHGLNEHDDMRAVIQQVEGSQ